MNLSITLIFIIACGIVSVMAFSRPQMLSKWIGWPYRMKNNNEYYRLLSSGFVHADYIHLIINLFVLYQFGTIVEMTFIEVFSDQGRIYYALLLLLGIAVPDLIDYFIHKDHPEYRSLGASGAVSAVLFSYVLFNPWAKIYLYGIIPIYTIVAALLYVIYSIYQDKKANDNVNHMAHLTGAVFGFVFTLMLKPGLWNYFIEEVINGAKTLIG